MNELRSVITPDLASTGRASGLRWRVSLVDGESVSGYVFAPSDPGRRWVLELTVDGIIVDVILANQFVDELWRAREGDGCYGFWAQLPSSELQAEVEVRVANTHESLRRFRLPGREKDVFTPVGQVQWQGGLRLAGWVGPSRTTPWLRFAVDGECVLECAPNRWSHVTRVTSHEAVPGFDVHLPREVADGRPKVVRVFSGQGEELGGSPLSLIAFPDALADALGYPGDETGENVRARLIDRIVPQSLPFAEYASWAKRFLRHDGKPGDGAIAVVVIGNAEAELDRTSRSLERQTLTNWVAGAIASPDGICFDPGDLAEFLRTEGRNSAAVVLMRMGTELEPNGLGRLAAAIMESPDAVLAYGDVTIPGRDGRRLPIAFPAFDYERLLEQGYPASLFVLRADALSSALQQGASSLFALALAPFAAELPPEELAVHVPGPVAHVEPLLAADALRDAVAAHLESRGVPCALDVGQGPIFPCVRVRRQAPAEPVTLIIPTRNRLDLLSACIDSVTPLIRAGRARLLVVDNDSDDDDTLAYLRALAANGATVERVTGEFNFSRLNNRAVERATTELICLLNNDVEALDEDWLDEMASRLAEPRVGAVGALLAWPSRVVQHGGVVLGQSFAAGHAHTGLMLGDPGYADLLLVAHQCSAVTGACLMTRRSLYRELGGLDETQFSVNFNDVDYCLRLSRAGLRTVFTPHARLIHNESSSRGADLARPKSERLRRELAALRLNWYDQLATDMLYNPILGLDPDPYTALAWPPRGLSPRAWAAPSVDEPLRRTME
ncbi:glycosyltransferase [Chelatococcus reniformis]|uniref:Glycosyl transferase n=1 Tax=Chelatococcus reniformis TaxID=1494448 RepID=A0A916UCS9_9HYPH|nr:glycosyltransferase [Chelatococcus reniformis]GGC67650.1 glycosyl transferase [Chelatococcus reniformis]